MDEHAGIDEEADRAGRASRRQVLAGMGLLAGVGATGALGLGGATAAAAAGVAPSGAGSELSALGVPAAALPPVFPGARTKALLFNQAVPLATLGSAELGWNNGTYLTTSGFMDVPLGVEPGSRVERVDIYANRVASGSVSMNLFRGNPSSSGAGVLITTITTDTGTGILTGAYTTPITLGAGDGLYLEATGINSRNITFTGAIVTYYDSTPGFNPITSTRVYDSRWSPAPAGLTTGTLTTSTSRVVSVANGRNVTNGAITVPNLVPPGASAVTYNLTVVAATLGGFLAITPGGATTYAASAINWNTPGTVIANGGVVPLDGLRNVKVFAAAGGADFIVDITGYYI